MIKIKDLLFRFKNIFLSEETKKVSIKNVLHQTVGLNIKSEDIRIKNNTIYLNIKPIYKSEIFLKKEEIFFKLKEQLGKKTPQNII